MIAVQGRRKSLGFPGFEESSWLLPGDLRGLNGKRSFVLGNAHKLTVGWGWGDFPFLGLVSSFPKIRKFYDHIRKPPSSSDTPWNNDSHSSLFPGEGGIMCL